MPAACSSDRREAAAWQPQAGAPSHKAAIADRRSLGHAGLGCLLHAAATGERQSRRRVRQLPLWHHWHARLGRRSDRREAGVDMPSNMASED